VLRWHHICLMQLLVSYPATQAHVSLHCKPLATVLVVQNVEYAACSGCLCHLSYYTLLFRFCTVSKLHNYHRPETQPLTYGHPAPIVDSVYASDQQRVMTLLYTVSYPHAMPQAVCCTASCCHTYVTQCCGYISLNHVINSPPMRSMTQ
jgi:hypothetical protein